MSTKDKEDHMICGDLSGIPKCCATFWINGWRYWSSKRRERYVGRIIPTVVNYVPCPKCVEKKEYVDITSIQNCEIVIPIKCPRRNLCWLWQRR